MASRTPPAPSRRVSGAPVKKPFPWGFLVGCAVVAALLAGILAYAVLNTGSGFRTAADRVDDRIDGVQVTENASFEHVSGRVDYPGVASVAPNGGNHNIIPQSCAVYTEPVVPEHAVHSLEHGAVWVAYRPDLPADQVEKLKGMVDGNPYRLLSPYPGLSSPIALQAWSRTLPVDSVDDPRVQEFMDGYTNGPQAREQGAQCAGVDVPGTAPFVQGADGAFVQEGSVLPSPTPAAPTPAAPAPAPAPAGTPPAPSASS